MDVVIPTHQRASVSQQATLAFLNKSGITPTLVVQESQETDYGRLRHSSQFQFDLRVLPPQIKTIAPTRDWIIHAMQGDKHVLILDDDLHFFARRSDDATKFRTMQREDTQAMLAQVDRALLNFPMVGLGAREGGNRVTEHRVYNTRIMRAMGLNREFLKESMMTCYPMPVMEDFHLNLQILRSGHSTVLVNDFVTNQAGGSAAPGGCTHFRTKELQTEAANKLAALHPGFVRVVRKQTKTAWGGEERTDVIVSWKKAYDYGRTK